jgi:DNA-binding NtrC family response regulator
MISDTLRVLFIDDDQAQSDVLAKLIRKKIAPAQVELFFATNLEAGIADSHSLIPCIVFLDLVFPETPDWRVTAEAINRVKGTVVVVTELDTADVEMECRARGAVCVFGKSKIQGLVEIIVHVITNIRLNNLARGVLPTNGCP